IPLDTSFWDEAMDIYAPIVAHESAAYHGPRTGNDFSHFHPAIAERLKLGLSISNEEIAQLDLRLAAFCQSMEELFCECDFVIAPCAPISRLLAGMDHSESRKMILRYTTPMSLAGLPVITLPARGGAGVQLIAAPGDDARLLAFTAGLAGGGHVVRGPTPAS
ncbi:MAG: amidase family protein, partial [Candidatus Acidiferrum sp.]